MIIGSLPTWEQILTLNFNKMKTTQTTTAQKPSLFLKAFAVLIAIKGVFFLTGAIYAAITNLL